MSQRAPFDATVSTTQPGRRDVLAPERDVAGGRYGSSRGRDAKRQHHDRAPTRSRRLRVWHVAAAVAVIAAATTGVVVATSGNGSQSAATTSTSPPTTVAATTIAPTTTLSPESILAQSLAGTYDVVQTVTDGNPNFPVGKVNTYRVTFTVTCVDGVCTVRSAQFYNVPAVIRGDQLTIDASPTEPCPSAGGVTIPGVITDSFEVVLRVTGSQSGVPSQLSGSSTLSSPEAAKCNTGNDPIASSLVFTRVP